MPDWSRIHGEKRLGPWTLPLALCSAIYGLGVRFRLGAYATDIFRRKSLPGFVVSVGNLTAGGTGKTPAVIMLAQRALGQGRRVAVLSRGYGSQGHQDILEVSDGQGRYADVRMAGDEPSLIARSVPESPVIISRSRYRAGICAYERFGSDFFILDDGFQHLQLKRDLDLVLMDAADPFGNGHLLPWGPLREPANQLGRADAFILTRFSRAQGKQGGIQDPNGKGRPDGTPDTDPTQHVMALLKKSFPSTPVFCADHEPDRLVFPLSGAVHDPAFLRGRRVVGFAGIAHPGQFEEMLTGLGADVVQFRIFRDHYPYRLPDMNDLIRLKEQTGAHFLLTTEKDWMRIAAVAPPYADLAYLCIRFSLLPGEDGVFRMIRDDFKK
jgi:tetraacyldisaccharide-1-P 4'-kinase